MDPNRRSLVIAGLVMASGLSACTRGTARTTPSPTGGSPTGRTTPTPGSPTPDTSATSATSGPSATRPAPAITEITTGLLAPWSIAFHGTTALVSERDTGRVLELTLDPSSGRASPTREVGTIAGVVHAGEGGLLGIAVHDGALHAYLTTASDNRIVRYSLTGAAGSLALSNPTVILAGIRKSFTHNGGRIAFGPDDMLYATVGDAGDRPSAQNLGTQDRGALNGKILRITPDGQVPDDNPFPGSLVHSYGHRNPQGLAWAPDGTLFASEFGQNTWDELNDIRPGANYGWPTVEGIAHRPGLIDPVQQWTPDEASPSGIAITGGAIWIANLKGNRLRRVPLSDPSQSTEWLVGEYGRLRDVVVAPDGHLWVLTNNTDGRGDPRAGDDRILRIDPSNPPTG